MSLNNYRQIHHPRLKKKTENLVKMDDLPQPESPIITILNKLSLLKNIYTSLLSYLYFIIIINHFLGNFAVVTLILIFYF